MTSVGGGAVSGSGTAKSPAPASSASASAVSVVHRILYFATGGVATASAAIFTNPADVVKTRMQCVGELTGPGGKRPPEYRNSFVAARTIARTDGWLGIQKGLPTAMLYQFFMNGVRLGAFAPIRDLYQRVSTALTSDGRPAPTDSFALTIASSASSGAVGAFIGSPFYLVKVRLQTQDKAALVRSNSAAAASATPTAGFAAASAKRVVSVGYQHAYTGPIQALISIGRTGGIRGLWQGVESAVTRVMIGSATQITTYEMVKSWLIAEHKRAGSVLHGALGSGSGDAFRTYLLSSLISGVAVTTAMNPFDVLSTRLYNQTNQYSSYFDCVRKTYAAEGVHGFYKGYTAAYLRLGPHTVLTFIFWEYLKQFVTKPA